MLTSPGLYVHLPWCIQKCPYCDFNSHAVRDTPPFRDYTDTVIADLIHQIERFEPPAFASVFFGGGTPSLFEPEQIDRILDTAARTAGIENNAEITLEANPGAIEHGSFAGYRSAGVNRVSLGVQSFGAEQLKRLGRIHSANDAHAAAASIRDAGIEQFNIDLMYGLPEQTIDMALSDIDIALELGPTHLSHYQLTIEPNTLFAVKTPKLPDHETCYEMQLACQQSLANAGYEHYEISAYAQPNCMGRHNLNYWNYGDYLGVGAGAHGKVTQKGRTVRTQKHKHPTRYMSEPLTIDESTPDSAEQCFEFMLNRLRLKSPIPAEQIRLHDWLNTPESRKRFEQAEQRGLLTRLADGGWSKTALGERFLNDVQEIFLP